MAATRRNKPKNEISSEHAEYEWLLKCLDAHRYFCWKCFFIETFSRSIEYYMVDESTFSIRNIYNVGTLHIQWEMVVKRTTQEVEKLIFSSVTNLLIFFIFLSIFRMFSRHFPWLRCHVGSSTRSGVAGWTDAMHIRMANIIAGTDHRYRIYIIWDCRHSQRTATK